jgi:tetratricopeptide (TPR) repeat protein
MQATGNDSAAEANHVRALQLYRSIGFRLGEAEVLNNLGDLAFGVDATTDALSHYGQALTIAKGVASPFEEARALEGLGQCQVRIGSAIEAANLLRQSLIIYQEIGSPNALRVEAALRHLEG